MKTIREYAQAHSQLYTSESLTVNMKQIKMKPIRKATEIARERPAYTKVSNKILRQINGYFFFNRLLLFFYIR